MKTQSNVIMASFNIYSKQDVNVNFFLLFSVESSILHTFELILHGFVLSIFKQYDIDRKGQFLALGYIL